MVWNLEHTLPLDLLDMWTYRSAYGMAVGLVADSLHSAYPAIATARTDYGGLTTKIFIKTKYIQVKHNDLISYYFGDKFRPMQTIVRTKYL
jgi:hypothetical protein